MKRLVIQNIIAAAVFAGLLIVAMVFVSEYGASIYNPFTVAAADPGDDAAVADEDEEEPEEPEETEEAQTLQASAEGYGGELTVELELVGAEIRAVRVVEHSETPGLSDPAIEQVPQAIVEQQSTEVDSVSGATVTSEAIKAATAAALEEAGL